MLFSVRFTICLLAALTVSALAQQPNGQAQPGTATVTGTVKLGDAPAPNIPVALQPEQMGRPGGGGRQQGQQPNQQADTTLQTSTDENGVFKFTAIPAGRYRVTLMTETYVSAPTNSANTPAPTLPPTPFANPSFGAANTKSVSVSEGQTVTGIDFTLATGGVITGRVSDQNDRPLIAERINLMTVDGNGQPRQSNAGNRTGLETDDRGVYRVYGLPPGKYLISAGSDGVNRNAPGAMRRATYARTYHPSATEVSEAQIIEVTPGSVAENINIRLGAPLKSYALKGKTVDAQSGDPVAGVTVNVMRDARNARGGAPPLNGFSGTSNEKGEFSISGLMPGKYAATVPSNSFTGGAMVSSEYYSEATSFEIVGDDATGVEVRVHRGASIAGMVGVEGANDPATTNALSQLTVFASARGRQGGQAGQGGQGGGQSSGGSGMAQVMSNGLFRISGLAPGTVRLSLGGGGFGGDGTFKLIRIERNGAQINGDIDLVSGDAVGGVRMVVGYASGVIQGRVVIAGGTLNGGRVTVSARPLNSSGTNNGGNNGRVEADGQFRIQNLLPGSYEVRATVVMGGPGGGGRGQGGRGGQAGQAGQGGTPTQPQVKMPEDRRTVTVANGSPASVTLTLNLQQ